MNYLLYTQRGDGIALAWKLQHEGESVEVYFADKNYAKTYGGIVKKAPSLSSALSKRPIILFDMVGAGNLADRLKKAGFKIIGAGMGTIKGVSLSDKLELDREYALKYMESVGISIPEMHIFTNLKEGINFAKTTQGSWVIKPCNNLPTNMTFVAKTSSEAVSTLEKWQKANEDIGKFVLQKFIEGPEISTEVWFNNGKPLLSPNSTIENKRFLNDNLGPNTGCQTSVVWGYREKEPRIYQKTIKKILGFIESTNYTGPLDINCIIGRYDQKAYGLEFCPRIGYNAIFAMIQCLQISLGKFLSDLVNEELKEMPWKSGFGGAVRITIPPYPFDDTDEKLKKDIYASQTGGKLISFDEANTHYFPIDILKNNDRYEVVGCDGVIMEVAGYGITIEELARDIYPHCKSLILSDKQFRTDLVQSATDRWYSLKQLGYVRGINNGISS
jgi:phosphoribosylamine-glycine ligase